MKIPANFHKWLAHIYPNFEKFTITSGGDCVAKRKTGVGTLNPRPQCHTFLTAAEVISHVATFNKEQADRKELKKKGFKIPPRPWERRP